jgi:short-subunit dehydrogenase
LPELKKPKTRATPARVFSFTLPAMARKTALITGASVGIGYELAKQFARGGYDLLLAARNEEKLSVVVDEVRALGVQAEFLVTDLAERDAPLALHAQVKNRGVPLDVLVNNAGFGALGPFHQVDLRRQLDMIQVNVAALVELTHRFLPDMIARKAGGGILNVASTAAFQPGPHMAIYYATKAFVLSFSEAIGEELAGTGVTVTALCPGPTESEFRSRAKLETAPVARSKVIPTATAESVARAGYQGFLRGKRIVVPGLVNKLAVQSNRIGPRRLVARVAGKINKAK